MSEDGLEALYDRFKFKFNVRPIQEDESFKQMLMGPKKYVAETQITTAELKEAMGKVDGIIFSEGMADLILKIRANLTNKGIKATDRTYNGLIKILKSEAYLNGRDRVNEVDFDVVRHVLWSKPADEKAVWSSILDEVAPEKGKILNMFEDAELVGKTALAEPDKITRHQMSVDATTKIRATKYDIEKLIGMMKKKGNSITEVEKYVEKTEVLLETVFKKGCGLNVDLHKRG